jgi:hypothetical protein
MARVSTQTPVVDLVASVLAPGALHISPSTCGSLSPAGTPWLSPKTVLGRGVSFRAGGVLIPLHHIEGIDEPLQLVGQRGHDGVLIMLAQRLPYETGQRPRQSGRGTLFASSHISGTPVRSVG